MDNSRVAALIFANGERETGNPGIFQNNAMTNDPAALSTTTKFEE